jgi:putative ABC transport system permease protein
MIALHRLTRRLFRPFIQSPGFAISVLLILGFGIGINTGAFCLVETTFLKPLPFVHEDRLVALRLVSQSQQGLFFSYPVFKDLEKSQGCLKAISASFLDSVDCSLPGQKAPIRFGVCFCTPGLFKVTGAPLILGHSFTENEDHRGGPIQVVLNERTWRKWFNSDRNILGKTLRLSGYSYEVIGVCPTQAGDLGYAMSVDLYAPSHVAEHYGYNLEARDERIWRLYGRLKPGVTLAQGSSELNLTYQNLATHYPSEESHLGVSAISLLSEVVGKYATFIWLIAAASGCLLLISIVNLAGLLTVRSSERRREMAIQLALGASRGRLIWQTLAETLGLTFWGALFGIFVALGTIDLIKAWAPDYLYRVQEIHLDGGALGWTFFLLLFAALSAGVLPAWLLTYVDPGQVLKQEGSYAGTSSPYRQRAQSILVTGQIGLVTLLLISAGLLIQSLRQIQAVPLGFDPKGVLTAFLYPTDMSKYPDNLDIRHFFDRVDERLRRTSGITSFTSNDNLPFVTVPTASFQVLGQIPSAPGREPKMLPQAIAPGYFDTLKIPFVRGRDFTKQDQMGKANVCIVDSVLADRFFPNGNVIGQQIEDRGLYNGRKAWTIIGVVAKSEGTAVSDAGYGAYQVYFPYNQRRIGQQYLLLRARGDPMSLVRVLRRAVAEVDPDVPLTDICTYPQLIDKNYQFRKLTIYLVSIYSVAALGLSIAGVYSVLAYYVEQRRRDIGIRIMLGASRKSILELIFFRELRLAGIGAGVGLVSAVIGFYFLRSVLYNTAPLDPVVILLSLLVVGLATSAACVVPALRAIRIDPMEVLRE